MEENNTVEEKQEVGVAAEQKPEEVVRPVTSEKKKKSIAPILILLLLLVIGGGCYYYFGMVQKPTKSEKTKVDSKEVYSKYRLSGNSLEDFDLYFLKLENEAKNKVYSPLSIKYALEMLGEGASGETKKQIDAVIGDYKAKQYPNNEHMSFANAMFIRDTFKESVKEAYTNNLKEKYNADVILDSFASPENINNWVSDRTFKLVNNLLDDVSEYDFFLINALAIDMNWNNQIHCETSHKIPCLNGKEGFGTYGDYRVSYAHEKLDEDATTSYSAVSVSYDSNEQFFGDSTNKHIFNGQEKTKGADILADYNRYDIIKELGEEKIRETVKPEYEKWLQSDEGKSWIASGYGESDVNKYLDKYIEQIKGNYGTGATSTDFLIYDDDNVKSFAKDLQTYDGMTLQYVGIMPKNEDLSSFIENSDAQKINAIVSGLKEVKIDSFKEGYATRIRGFIPFFQFEYELELLEDLKKVGITDVFDSSKADLGNITGSHGTHISKAVHKANIEFSNDGIKASAATAMGGQGSTSGGFDYIFKIPVIDIDISFDKPYMYIIRDKDSGEVWFTGTVYEPIRK